MPRRKTAKINPLFGQRLKQYRTACDLTQQQIADKLNIHRTTYTKYETGGSEPTLNLLSRIVSILGVDFNSILGEKDTSKHCINNTKTPILKLSKDEQNLIVSFRSLSNDERLIIINKVIEFLDYKKTIECH